MPKVHVLYDKSGNILSVGVHVPRVDFSGPAFGVQPAEGQYAASLEVGGEDADLELHQLPQKLRVDVAKRHLVAKS